MNAQMNTQTTSKIDAADPPSANADNYGWDSIIAKVSAETKRA